jgi:hypothetical protein
VIGGCKGGFLRVVRGLVVVQIGVVGLPRRARGSVPDLRAAVLAASRPGRAQRAALRGCRQSERAAPLPPLRGPPPPTGNLVGGGVRGVGGVGGGGPAGGERCPVAPAVGGLSFGRRHWARGLMLCASRGRSPEGRAIVSALRRCGRGVVAVKRGFGGAIRWYGGWYRVGGRDRVGSAWVRAGLGLICRGMGVV